MAEGQTYQSMNLAPIIRNLATVSGQVEAVGHEVERVDRDLQEVRAKFFQMLKEQRQQAALQRALTEIIRVRQELEDKFGNHKHVRDNIVGILQATDTKLITGETISRCSEELMLSTPNYWLAPCVVALAAWIGSDEALAKRAIKEAVRRDREKTSLLYALICRRNGRTDACFKWLSEYLKQQNPNKMRTSVMAFVDGYLNGAFGEDKDNVCYEYMMNWISILKDTNPEFDVEQKNYWKNFFNIRGQQVKFASPGYNILQKMSPDFPKIDAFVGRITSVHNNGGAKDELKNISSLEVNVEELIEKIDAELTKLVTNYEEGEEAKLRDEELFFSKVKETNGNEEYAENYMKALKLRRFDKPVDFAQILRTSVANTNAAPSARKAALYLVKDYIVEAYKEYIEENKGMYPEEITLKINDNDVVWTGTTKAGENADDMKKQIGARYNTALENAITAKKPSTAKKVVVGIFTLGIGILVLNSSFKKAKASLEENYAQRATGSKKQLDMAVGAKRDCDAIVNEFLAKGNWNELEF